MNFININICRRISLWLIAETAETKSTIKRRFARAADTPSI